MKLIFGLRAVTKLRKGGPWVLVYGNDLVLALEQFSFLAKRLL